MEGKINAKLSEDLNICKKNDCMVYLCVSFCIIPNKDHSLQTEPYVKFRFFSSNDSIPAKS